MAVHSVHGDAIRSNSIVADIAFFIALLSSALSLGVALAHAFELPNKIGLSIADYFLVQQAYRGWNRLAIILLVQFAALCASAVMSRRPPIVFWCCVTAIGWLVAAQLLFWSFTYPANVATANWTQMPANAGHLRIQWEYSHAAGAACQLLAMSFLAVAVLARVRRRS